MVPTVSRLLRHWRHASSGIVVLLLSLSLAACSTPADMTPTAVSSATMSTNPSPQIPASTPSSVATSTESAPTDPTPSPESDEQPESAATIAPEVLASEITGLVDQVEGLVEVVIALPDGTTVSEINGFEPMEAASLYKLAILVEVYVQRETGELQLDEEVYLAPEYFSEEDSVFSEDDIGSFATVDTLLQTMITLSSNVAATALLARVGNENVNATMASLGLTATEIRWSPGFAPVVPDEEEIPAEDDTEEVPTEEVPPDAEPTEEEGAQIASRSMMNIPGSRILLDPRADAALNVTTAADVAALYVMLINGQIISDAVSQEMLVLLEQQQINDRLPAYLPEGTVVAHKTGNLDGLVHDAGVIFAPAGPLVVVVMTEDVEEWQAVDLIATIAQLAYESGLQPTD